MIAHWFLFCTCSYQKKLISNCTRASINNNFIRNKIFFTESNNKYLSISSRKVSHLHTYIHNAYTSRCRHLYTNDVLTNPSFQNRPLLLVPWLFINPLTIATYVVCTILSVFHYTGTDYATFLLGHVVIGTSFCCKYLHSLSSISSITFIN